MLHVRTKEEKDSMHKMLYVIVFTLNIINLFQSVLPGSAEEFSSKTTEEF